MNSVWFNFLGVGKSSGTRGGTTRLLTEDDEPVKGPWGPGGPDTRVGLQQEGDPEDPEVSWMRTVLA